ncbi:MAG: hypothetical protein ABW145_12895 [Candidatus Thiodiazotropha sp.]
MSHRNPPPGAYLISDIIIATAGYLIGPWFWGVIIGVIVGIELGHKWKSGRGFFPRFPQ